MLPGEKDSFRFDLDDVVGEVLLLRWGEAPQSHAAASAAADGSQGAGKPHILCGAQARTGTEIFRYGNSPTAVLAGANFLEDGAPRPFWDRRLQLGGNPLVTPLAVSASARDPVGRDLLEIAAVMRRIEADWAKGE